MKVVYSVLGASVLAALVACSGAKPDSASQAGASTTTAGTTPSDSSDTSSSTPASTATDAGVTDPDAAVDTDAGAAVTDGPQTCDSLAAAAGTPAGTLQVTSVHGITPVDVYATQDDNALTIVLTTTANECGYRNNNLAHQSVQELQFITQTPDGGFVPGTFKPFEVLSQQGDQCIPDDADFNGGFFPGMSFREGSARGTLTITAIDATSVTGTMNVTDFQGAKQQFTFTAPICAGVSQDQVQAGTCCADPNQH